MEIAVVCRVESKHMTVVWPSGSRVGVAPKVTDRRYAPSVRLEYGSKSGAIFVDLFTYATPIQSRATRNSNLADRNTQPPTRNSQLATRITRSFHHQLRHRLLQAVEGQLKHGKDLADDPYGAGVVPHGSRHGI